MLHRWVCCLLICVLWQSQRVAAGEPSADFLTKLFMDVCVPNMGHPDKVRQWANERHLEPVIEPTALRVFVGPGGKGGAWAVPAQGGSFALAIRGTTEGCAVWARTAHPGEVEGNFKKIIEGVNRPGLKISIERNTASPSPVGQARALVYSIFANNAKTGFVFTMLTAERPGGAFQASLQVAPSSLP
jgi:hypothetical protein